MSLQNSKCAAYVLKALEKKGGHGKAANAPSYEECLSDMTGEEEIPECIKHDSSKSVDIADGHSAHAANSKLYFQIWNIGYTYT